MDKADIVSILKRVNWENVRRTSTGGLVTSAGVVLHLYALLVFGAYALYSVMNVHQFECRDMRTGVSIPDDHKGACQRAQYGVGFIDAPETVDKFYSTVNKMVPIFIPCVCVVLLLTLVLKIVLDKSNRKLHDALASQQNMALFFKNNFGGWSEVYGRLFGLQVVMLLVDILMLLVVNYLLLQGHLWEVLVGSSSEEMVHSRDIRSLIFAPVSRCDMDENEGHMVGMAGVYYACRNKMAMANMGMIFTVVGYFTLHVVVTLCKIIDLVWVAVVTPAPTSRYATQEVRLLRNASAGDILLMKYIKTDWISARQYDDVIRQLMSEMNAGEQVMKV